jgi:mannose-6-phosphate isomerase
MSLAPIVLRGELHPTIWGGNHLATLLGKTLPHDTPIGEAWETGLAAGAMNAPYAGKTLGDITADLGESLIGSRARALMGDRFPLLVKFLDAQAWLSVQVHPDDEYATRNEGGKLGKTEAWRILHTNAHAQIIHGFARATARDEVAAAITAGTLDALLQRVDVHPGEVFLNLAGTVHATGAGIVLYEVQEYSDVTYRLHDFGRRGPDGQPRELHIPQALDVLHYDPLPQHACRAIPIGPREQVGMDAIHEHLLVACTHFALQEAVLAEGYTCRRATDGTSCQIVSVIAGDVNLSWGSAAAPQGISLGVGETVVLPAAPETFHFTPDVETGNLPPRLLIAWVPQPEDPLVAAWHAAQD